MKRILALIIFLMIAFPGIVRAEELNSPAVEETNGFSHYTDEFTYNNLEYVLPGGTSVQLS